MTLMHTLMNWMRDVKKMFYNSCLDVNENNHLTIGGCDTTVLAREFGTPLYVMDEKTIRDNCKLYVNSLEKYYNGNGKALFASKALSCKELYRIVTSEKMGVDVVSGGELYTAIKAGVQAENIHFHGNNKTAEEINLALDFGIGRFVVDNLTELEMLNKMAAGRGKVVNILMRIKPGVDAHTHDFIMTGQIDSKFGFALETGEAFAAIQKAIDCKNVDLKGIHCHIGSQIFDIEPFVTAAEIMMDLIIETKNKTGHLLTELNLGGGFGIHYTDNDTPPAYDSYMEKVSATIKTKALNGDIPVPFIYLEPGRSIVGEAGITLYTVGAVKDIPGIRTYVSVDGSMCDNIRYALYQAEYTVVNASKAGDKPSATVTIAGKCCETGDLIQENTQIAKAVSGDILAVLSTGAYNYSMASNYNKNTKPAIVMVRDGEPRIIVKRESYEDLIKNDI